MKQTDGVYECKNPECSFRLKKHIASHEITEAEARELITNRQVGPIETFKNRFGAQFTAELTLEKAKRSWKVNFVFEGDSEREDELKNLSEDQLLCEVPILDGADELVKVYETERAFLSPKMATKKDERGVRLSKTILQKEIPTDQAFKLFMEGKTDLMPDFVSKKKGRKFAAHLTLDRATGKIGFEFAPPKKKAEGDKAAKKSKATTKKAPAKRRQRKKPRRKNLPEKRPPKRNRRRKTTRQIPAVSTSKREFLLLKQTLMNCRQNLLSAAPPCCAWQYVLHQLQADESLSSKQKERRRVSPVGPRHAG